MAHGSDRAAVAATLSRRTVFKLAAVAGAGAAGVAPLAQTAMPVAAQEAQPLIIGRNIDDVITLDPNVAGEETYTIVLRGCYDTLISTEPDDPATIVPLLAESWTTSDDALTYTFTLKPGLTFPSGNELTSADVKFSFDRLRELKALPAYLMDPVASVEAPDPLTVVLTLKSPDAVFLTALCSSNFATMDSKVAMEHGATDQPGADATDTAVEWLTQNSIGTGPYILTGFTPKDRITMTANPSSSRQPAIPNVVIQAAADTSALKQMLERGDVDLAWGLLNEQIAELRGNPDVAIATTPMLGFIALGMTCDTTRNEAVANPAVRQAIKQAVDYDGIRSLQEGALTPPSLVPIGLPGALDPAKDGFHRDVAAAKAAIAAAGYPDGFSATLATSATEIIGGVALALLAEKLQADLSEVGIDVTLEVEDEESSGPSTAPATSISSLAPGTLATRIPSTCSITGVRSATSRSNASVGRRQITPRWPCWRRRAKPSTPPRATTWCGRPNSRCCKTRRTRCSSSRYSVIRTGRPSPASCRTRPGTSTFRPSRGSDVPSRSIAVSDASQARLSAAHAAGGRQGLARDRHQMSEILAPTLAPVRLPGCPPGMSRRCGNARGGRGHRAGDDRPTARLGRRSR